MNKSERLVASKEQIRVYNNNRYTQWHYASVMSIRKILLNLDSFYSDLVPELASGKDQCDIVHCQIRNAWFYEAVSHAEQAIEDLFATIMNMDDPAYFVKDELFYFAGKVKDFIWNFDADSIEEICDQFGYPFFPLNEPWENGKVFDTYKEAILLTQRYIKELKVFHKYYYDDYCQYKHGLSVSLTPIGNPLMKDDEEHRKAIMENPSEAALYTFHNGTAEDYMKRTGESPNMMIQLKPGMQSHVSALHDEGNLLFATIHRANIDEVLEVTKHACILLNVVWENVIKCIDYNNDDYLETAFPLDMIEQHVVIGFPKPDIDNQ